MAWPRVKHSTCTELPALDNLPTTRLAVVGAARMLSPETVLDSHADVHTMTSSATAIRVDRRALRGPSSGGSTVTAAEATSGRPAWSDTGRIPSPYRASHDLVISTREVTDGEVPTGSARYAWIWRSGYAG
jgi:hypothetical protein